MRPFYVLAGSVALGAVLAAPARAADVHVGVHIGVPPPPAIVFEAPPRLVVVPGYPHVHYAPDVSVNFFSYGGRYYTYDNDGWFVAHDHGGPWRYVDRRHVPGPLLRVPSRYYHVPPRLVGGGHWDRGRGDWGRDRGHRGHGRGHGQGKHGKHGKHKGDWHRH